MAPELVVVEGPLLGSRFALTSEVSLGRDPAAGISLASDGVSWRHCTLRPGDAGVELIAHASVYVNGLLTKRELLQRGDHIGIGATTLLYSTEEFIAAPESNADALLRACTILYLVRGIAVMNDGPERQRLHRQFSALLADMMSIDAASLMIGEGPAGLRRALAAQGASNLSQLIERVATEGSCIEASTGWLAAPLICGGHMQGAIIAHAAANAEAQQDALASIATLAAMALQTSREVQGLQLKTSLLEEALEQRHGIAGGSGAMQRLLAQVDRVAQVDATVLLLGESGSGKELIARAIHRKSARATHAMVAINCAALTDTLLESELFGHEKGAFTGAVAQKRGKLEMGQGGSVFLDEIGELAGPMQAKLLRVLQEREFERVGGTQTIPLNVRIIAATNRDLAAEVKRGAFREDLYHRLNVVVLRTPPLRERREDILPLAQLFLERFAARCHRRVHGISPEAAKILAGYNWPGNVRELENAIERAVVLGETEMLLPEDLPETVFELHQPAADLSPILASVGEAKRESVVRAWNEARGDSKVAARMLGLHPNSLLRLIRTLGLRHNLPRF